MTSTAPNILAIRNTLALYCQALDNKNFALLSQVFTPDAVSKYPFHAEDFQGVDEVRDAIMKRLGPIRTHHALSTQTLTFSPSPSPSSPSPPTAKATTYFTATHFGQGPHAGSILVAYGIYVDELVCLEEGTRMWEGGSAEGASGAWRIKKRKVEFVGRVGDEGIMREF